MKKFLILILILLSNFLIVFANNNGSSNKLDWKSDPEQIISGLKSDLQTTKFNSVNGSGVKSTLDSIGKKFNPYLKWIIFIGLSVGTILIIINGIFFMKDASVGNSPDLNKFRTRMLNIAIGVFLLTGFAIVIQIFVSILNSIFG